MPVHVRLYRNVIRVVAAYNPFFHHAIARKIPAEAFKFYPSDGTLDLLKQYESVLWWSIRDAYGLGSICARCLNNDCEEIDFLATLFRNDAERQFARDEATRYDARRNARREDAARKSVPTFFADSATDSRDKVARPSATESDAAKVLGLELPASSEQIKKAFRRAALAAHPDRGGSDEAMRRVLVARDVLLESS